jgi:hypothetical protein
MNAGGTCSRHFAAWYGCGSVAAGAFHYQAAFFAVAYFATLGVVQAELHGCNWAPFHLLTAGQTHCIDLVVHVRQCT